MAESGPVSPGGTGIVPRKAGAALLATAYLLVPGLAACGGDASERELPVLYRAPDFALVDQRGDTLRGKDLRGQAWAASFVFTNCRGICPTITAGMAGVRDSLEGSGLLGGAVRLVSFSTDPARDRPPILRSYAAKFGDSPPEEWAFLTGWPPDSVRALLERGFHVTAVLPDSAPPAAAARADTAPGYQVGHSPRILVVDGKGRVRSTYNARLAGAFDSTLADLRALAGEP